MTGVPGQEFPPEETCDVCGAKVPGRGRFCPYCGNIKPSIRQVAVVHSQAWSGASSTESRWSAQYRRPPAAARRGLIKTIVAAVMLSYIVHLVFTLVILVYGVGIVLPEIVNHEYGLYIVLWEIFTAFTLSGDALGIYYLLLVAAILASALYWFMTGLGGYVKELTARASSRKHSPIFEVCGLMFAILFVNSLVVLVTEALWGGVPLPTEDADLWELLFLLANASVWEELVTRVLLIGGPLILFDIARRRLRAKKSSYLLGGGFEFGVPEVTLVLITAVVFGAAHVPSWGMWKFFPSAVAGAAFGYLFLRHGLASAIMLHFAFDYLSMPLMVFDNNIGLALILGIGVLLWIGFGALMAGYYVVRILEFITGGRYFEGRTHLVGAPFPLEAPPPVSQSWQWGPLPMQGTGAGQPQRPDTEPEVRMPSGGFGFSYVCPVCGNREARWIEGRYQCLRCGHLR